MVKGRRAIPLTFYVTVLPPSTGLVRIISANSNVCIQAAVEVMCSLSGSDIDIYYISWAVTWEHQNAQL